MDFIINNFESLVLLPLIIFVARSIDVALLTLRVILISKENKILSLVVCVMKGTLYVIVLGVLFKNLNSTINVLFYALGCGFGNYLGLYIEEKLSLGLVTIRIIITVDKRDLIKQFTKIGYGLTLIDACGSTKCDVKILLTTIHKKELKNIKNLIDKYAKGTFYTVEDAKSAKNGVFKPRGKTKKVA